MDWRLDGCNEKLGFNQAALYLRHCHAKDGAVELAEVAFAALGRSGPFWAFLGRESAVLAVGEDATSMVVKRERVWKIHHGPCPPFPPFIQPFLWRMRPNTVRICIEQQHERVCRGSFRRFGGCLSSIPATCARAMVNIPPTNDGECRRCEM